MKRITVYKTCILFIQNIKTIWEYLLQRVIEYSNLKIVYSKILRSCTKFLKNEKKNDDNL